MRPVTTILLTLFFLPLCVGAIHASVHDIHLHTDSTPDYVSLEDFVATATSVWSTPEEEAIAIWRWVVRTHLQDSATFEDGDRLWDPVQFFASYPNTFCGYVASYVTAFADVRGAPWRHRYIELSDHTVAEVSWDDGASWHMFDTSMRVFARRHDGTIASCTEIAATGSCELSAFWGAAGAEAGHLYLYHVSDECMTNPPDPNHPLDLGYPSGYRKATENPVGFSRTLRNGADSYISGIWIQEEFTHIRTGWRNRLQLHPGQIYTRYWAALGSGAEYARLNTKGEDPNDSTYPANIRGNGRWEIAPDFGAADPAGGWHQLQNIVHRDEDGGGGPALRPATTGAASAVVKVDGANVITSARVYVQSRRGGGDQALLEYSRDAGCTWSTVAGLPAGTSAAWYDLPSSLVGGACDLLIRVRLVPDATRTDVGLDELQIEAITQINSLALPRLQRGANRVRFASGRPQETLTLRPSLDSFAGRPWTDSAAAHAGLISNPGSTGYANAIVVPTQAGVPGFATWRFDTPTDILDASLGGSFLTRYTGSGDEVRLQFSWNGVDYNTAAIFDAETAPTWDARLFAGPQTAPPGARTIWLRYEVASSVAPSNESTGIQDMLLQVQHAAHDPQLAPVAVTYSWTEHRTAGDVTRQHTRIVTTREEIWDINVGGYRDPTMEWVRVELAAPGMPSGYADGVDVGPGAGYDKTRITAGWLDDLALGRPYTVSRPSAALNPDDGGIELTNGVVIPPTDQRSTYYVQGQVAYWEGDTPLTVTVDLGSDRTFNALRVTSHQPDAQFGHAGTITATGIAADGTEFPLGVIQHDDIWSPPGDHLDWGYVRSGNFADLPAKGRLAYGYWLLPATPVTAREVRLAILPQAGRGVGLSEIQVFANATVTDWPDREVDLGTVSAVGDPVASGDAAAPRRLQVVPNPANPGTHIHYHLPAATEVTLRILDVRGMVVRTLAAGLRPAGAHRAFWDGRDGQGRAVASGVYLAVASWPGGRSVGRVTLVR